MTDALELWELQINPRLTVGELVEVLSTVDGNLPVRRCR